jgi:anti-anti-sigma factor
MRECHIKHEAATSVDILHLDGALDAYSFPRLESALTHLRDGARHRIVLDCSSLDYVNSAALGALIGYARRARERAATSSWPP